MLVEGSREERDLRCKGKDDSVGNERDHGTLGRDYDVRYV